MQNDYEYEISMKYCNDQKGCANKNERSILTRIVGNFVGNLDGSDV